MKLSLVNTPRGFLVPESDADYDSKARLRIGETYTAEIKLVRNPEFHRLYFQMMRTAWEFLPEAIRTERFHDNQDAFRKCIEITAGYYEEFYSQRFKDWVQGPKSIAFEKLDETGFRELYNSVRNVLDKILTRYISMETFEQHFMRF